MNQYIAPIGDRVPLATVPTLKGARCASQKLAQLAGLHRTFVSSVERGERTISLFNIESLAGALGVKMAELMPD
jgi:transcriptional regulator with XRE-family HTH domain